MLKIRFLFLYFLILLERNFAETYCSADNEEGPVIRIQTGKIRGRMDTTIGQNKTYYIFEGIPFAQPPIGNLRFEPPVPAERWKGILNTQKYKGSCVQSINFPKPGSIAGSEDCLYLNVYSPNLRGSNLPVMVWIHGGGFLGGSSDPNNTGPDYLIDHDVIVVRLNYRLGIFGFLSTGDLVAPGNAGLKDQLLALKWVKRNIAKFGGNPYKITLFGQSAGAASVAYHLTSSKSKGLFRNSIMHSGTSLCLWALSRKMKEAVTLVAESYGLNVNDSKSLVENLKRTDVESVYNVSMNISNNLEETLRKGFVFSPVAEPSHSNAFFTKKSHQLLVKKKFHSGPVILGFTSMESLAFPRVVSFYLNRKTKKYDFVPVDLNIKSETENEKVYNKIRKFYFGSKPVYNQKNQTYNFVSIDLFVRPIMETTRLLAKKTKTYLYEFTYVGNLSQFSNNPVPGASHIDDLFYIWRKDSNKTTPADALMRSRMTKLWTNFAKYNNPTPSYDALFNNTIWQESDTVKDNYLYLRLDNELDLHLNPFNNDIKFWTKIYKDHGYPPFDTY